MTDRVKYWITVKYREQFLYLVFGLLATAISIVTFTVCIDWLQLNELLSNVISWIAAVSFAFFSNRKLVFCSAEQNAGKQSVLFLAGRLFTLILEELVFIVLMTVWNRVKLIKLFGQAIVIITNYFISKWIVFKAIKE